MIAETFVFTKQPLSEKEKMTEAEFIRQRRRIVNAEVSHDVANTPMTKDDVLIVPIATSSNQWCATKQKCENKYIARQRTSIAEAAIGGNVWSLLKPLSKRRPMLDKLTEAGERQTGGITTNSSG